jgi:hypothetical protein
MYLCGTVSEGLILVLWYFEVKFSICPYCNANLAILSFSYKKCEFMQKMLIIKVFLRVLFHLFYSAAVAYQLVITHIHTCHCKIIADCYFGLLNVLVSNPSLNQFFIMCDIHQTSMFHVFTVHDHKFNLVYCHIFLLFKFCLLSFVRHPLPILMQYAHDICLFSV